MTATVFLLASLACVCAVIASARVGAASLAKDSMVLEPVALQRQRRASFCDAVHPCRPAFYCDTLTEWCLAKRGRCTLLLDGRAVAGSWSGDGCYSFEALHSSGACNVLIDGATVTGNWRNGVCEI